MRREPLYKKVSELPVPAGVQASSAAASASNSESKSVIEVLNADHHAQLIHNNRVLVLYLYAPSCGPCRAMAPRYEELANQWSPRGVVFAKENALLRLTEGIKATPTTHFYVNGKLHGDFVGADVSRIQEIISQIVQTS